MKRKTFLILPLAALALGKSVHAPRLRAPLPAVRDSHCDYASAVDFYLRAFAYSGENKETALSFLRAADSIRQNCAQDTSALAARIASLKQILSP